MQHKRHAPKKEVSIRHNLHRSFAGGSNDEADSGTACSAAAAFLQWPLLRLLRRRRLASDERFDRIVMQLETFLL
jgi:hypothetical protein